MHINMIETIMLQMYMHIHVCYFPDIINVVLSICAASTKINFSCVVKYSVDEEKIFLADIFYQQLQVLSY